ncbi:hypothetical protein LMG23994_01315 [Cupriavidus pinatubonensis]|uniref:Uncharacterized protein n=1 Tax=Cupriavidus pinatubonensis TaxID=248026 RepID=A0ABM8WLN6_9BURK|nr:hypothetical protein LMG23994_01315 [Cupriavidus pinatubonensis]
MPNKSKMAADEAARNASYGDFSLCKAYGPAFQVAAANHGANQSVAAPRVVGARARNAMEKLSDKADQLLKSLRGFRGH